MLRGRLTLTSVYLIWIIWIQAVFAGDKEKPCTIHDGDNFYNLNKLSAACVYHLNHLQSTYKFPAKTMSLHLQVDTNLS